ncbi:MAG: Asp-tRNA(Asn)/Glu-tRNA(Gln) amidotransferase subunit GatB, partial [Bacteroidota bacterium]
SQHDQLPGASVIDLNRAGVGLVEMVTLPVIGNAELAGATVAAVRRLVRCLEVSDGHMEQGSLRCDANVSIKPVGQEQLGTRVEIKNINSISHVIRAIQYEIKRQEALIRSGGSVVQETRTWHMERLETQAMREKETADDYRYFPEPDLLPIQLSDEMLAESAGRLPVLPHVCFEQYHQQLGLSLNEAFALVDDPAYNRYFEAWRAISATPKAAAHWLLGPVRAWLNETQSELDSFSLQPEQLEQIVALIQTGTISHGAAKQQLFPAMLEQPDVDPGVLAESLGLVLKSQVAEVEAAMTRVMEQFPDKVASYQKGKKGLKGFFVGQVMRAFKGQADPKEVNTIVQRLLG